MIIELILQNNDFPQILFCFRGIFRQIRFFFIEEDERRANNLKKKIASIQLLTNFKVRVICDRFEDCVGNVLQNISGQGKRLAPSFFFIDPFGPTGFSMQLLEKICGQDRSEVLINFSYQSLNQWFLKDPSKHKSIDLLFGSDVWRKVLTIGLPQEKENYLRLTYQSALEKLGWKVRPFCMINKHNQPQYYLFFATKSPLGMLAMKSAMWKSAPTGDFEYSDLSNIYQPNMFQQEFEKQYAQNLAEEIYSRHKGTSITKENLLNEDVAWHPVCIRRHLTRALTYLEYEISPPLVAGVTNRKSQRRGTYPDGCTITFS